jgi:hypothetical protein
MAFTVRMHFSINPKSFLKPRKTNPPKKKSVIPCKIIKPEKTIQTKKKFHCQVAKHFHFKKNCIKPEKVCKIKHRVGERKKFWRYFLITVAP